MFAGLSTLTLYSSAATNDSSFLEVADFFSSSTSRIFQISFISVLIKISILFTILSITWRALTEFTDVRPKIIDLINYPFLCHCLYQQRMVCLSVVTSSVGHFSLSSKSLSQLSCWPLTGSGFGSSCLESCFGLLALTTGGSTTRTSKVFWAFGVPRVLTFFGRTRCCLQCSSVRVI